MNRNSLNKTLVAVFSLLILLTAGSGYTAADAAKKKKAKYIALQNLPLKAEEVSLTPTANLDNTVTLKIRERDLVVDLAQVGEHVLNLNVNVAGYVPFYPSNVKVMAYEYTNDGQKQTISTTIKSLLNKKQASRLPINVVLDQFETESREVFFDVYDNYNRLISTAKTTIFSTNFTAQQSIPETPLPASDCTEGVLSECHLEYIFSKIDFEAKPLRFIQTRVARRPDGTFKVTIPIARRKLNSTHSGRRVSLKNLGAEGILGQTLQFGVSAEQMAAWAYDDVTDMVRFDMSGHVSDRHHMSMDANGGVGIGINEPGAFLHIRRGDGVRPSIMLENGELTPTPLDGAIEFDGDDFYFSSNGSRRKLSTYVTSLVQTAGIISSGSLPTDVVYESKVQTVSNKTLNDTTVTGDFTITTNGGLNKLLVSDANGKAEWKSIAEINGIALSVNVELSNGSNLFVGNGAGLVNNGGEFNTGIGVSALNSNTEGNGNTSLGFQSLFNNTNGDHNVALGAHALANNTSGNGNISIGFRAGDNITNGDNNIVIGYDIDVPDANGSDQLNIGDAIFGDLVNGNIGIGETDPQAKLHVNGDVIADNFIGNFAVTLLLTTTDPVDDSTGHDIGDDLTASFNSLVIPGTGNIKIRELAGDALVANMDVTNPSRVSFQYNTVTLDPSSDLDYDTDYYVEVDSTAILSGFNTASGYTGITDNGTWNFTTGSHSGIVCNPGTPSDNSTVDNGITAFSLSCNVNVNLASGLAGDEIEIRRSSNGGLLAGFDADLAEITSSGSNVNFTYSGAPLPFNTGFYINIVNNFVENSLSSGNFYGGISNSTDWNFTVKVTPTPFDSISFSPSDNSTTVDKDTPNFNITFDEDISGRDGSGNEIKLYQANGSLFEAFDFGSAEITQVNSTRLRFTPSTDFAYGASYYVTINGDLAENAEVSGDFYTGFSSNTTWNFTVDAMPNVTSGNSETIDMNGNACASVENHAGSIAVDDLNSDDIHATTITIDNNKVAGDGTVTITLDASFNVTNVNVAASGDDYVPGTQPTSVGTRYEVPDHEFAFYIDPTTHIMHFFNEFDGGSNCTARELSVDYTRP